MFTPLNLKEITDIVKVLFEDIQERLIKQNVTIEATEFAIEELARLGYDPQFGARPLKRVIQKKVLNQLSKEILGGAIKPGSKIKLDVFESGNFVFVPV